MQIAPDVERRPTSEADRSAPVTIGMLLAVVVGIGVGFLTAYGQGWLGDSSGSLANSAGPWSVAAFLVARYNRRIWPAVAAATLTLACSEIGYAIATARHRPG